MFSSALTMFKRGIVGAFWASVTLFSLFAVIVAIEAILPGSSPIVICGIAAVVLITIVFLAKFIVEWITIAASKSPNKLNDQVEQSNDQKL